MKLKTLMLCSVPILMSALMAFGQGQDETDRKPSRTPPGRQAKSQPGQRPAGGLGGGMTFGRIAERHDSNKDGKITSEEFKGPAQFFERMDADGDGVLTKKEFESRSGMRPGGRPKSDKPSPEDDAASDLGTSREDLQAILKGREGRLKPGDAAPDFKLKRLEGNGEVQLSQVIGKRPVVLIFGSYT